jgi:cation diffusion facilitator family transporter
VVWYAGEVVVGGGQRLGHQPADVVTAGGVEHPAALSVFGHQTGQPQFGQVLGYRRSGSIAQGGDQLGHAAFAVAEVPQQPQSGVVSHQAQHRHRGADLIVGGLLRMTRTCTVVACAHEHLLWVGPPAASNPMPGDRISPRISMASPHQSGDHDQHTHHDHLHNQHHDPRYGGWWHRIRHVVTPHSHDSTGKVDAAMQASRDGMRALWISLVGLGVTAVLQAVVVAVSGSVALLGDTLHNVADALTAVPLGVAFLVGRRKANRRYTYGYGRAEDLAGIVIVVLIAASAALAAGVAVDRLLHPAPVHNLPAVAAAALVGFAGNELVARYRISVGRRIGSAALVADGLHARTDGFTSLAVLLGAGGVSLGLPWVDPVVGLVITVAIVFVLKDAAREIYHRLMDAVDPALVDTVERTLAGTPGVEAVGAVKLRWIGHSLHAETDLIVDADLSVASAHAIAVNAEHRLLHAMPRLAAATVHTDPATTDTDPHHPLAHHRPDSTSTTSTTTAGSDNRIGQRD